MFLLFASAAPLNFGFPSLIGSEIQLDRPTLAFDYRIIEQITDPWVIDVRLGKSCLLQDFRARPRALEFSFRNDLRWSDGSPIPMSEIQDQFRRLLALPRFRDLIKVKESSKRWTLSWADSIHTIVNGLQRSEFGLIHPLNRKRLPWSSLGPTFGPYKVELGDRIRIIPNPFYPQECGVPSLSFEFFPSGNFAKADLENTKPDVVQMDSDRAIDSETKLLLESGATEVGLGSTAVWTAVVFDQRMNLSERAAWGRAMRECVVNKTPLPSPKRPIEIVAPKIYTSSRALAALMACYPETLKVSFVETEQFAARRVSGLATTFNHLGLRFPDPDDKWTFLREFYPYLKKPFISDARLEKARLERKNGSLDGYNAFDRINERDPWIVLLNNVKTRIFLRKGLMFRSESDSTLRLGGIRE